MAKGNLILGTAAKSIGDVVVYRRDGQQISRVRVRKIANPKTDAQCEQRAIMAPIPKFFSPLSIVLERSFEGLSKSKSYSKFLKVNANKARANNWLLPKGIGFFPLPYTLSQGSIQAISIAMNTSPVSIGLTIDEREQAVATLGDLSSVFISKGYNVGDVVTIILCGGTTTDGYYPKAFQFEINPNDTTTFDNWDNDITVGNSDPTHTSLQFYLKAGNTVAGTIIISRFENDKWRRTTQNLLVAESIMTSISSTDYKAAAIASYRGTVDGGNPLVYLDGEELQ